MKNAETLLEHTYFGTIHCDVSDEKTTVTLLNYLLQRELSFSVAEKITWIGHTLNYAIFLVPSAKKIYTLRVDVALLYMISLDDMSGIHAVRADAQLCTVGLQKPISGVVPELTHLAKLREKSFKLPVKRFLSEEASVYVMCTTCTCCFLAINTSNGARMYKIRLEPSVKNAGIQMLQYDGGVVKDMQAGRQHVLVLTCDGRLYSFGMGTRGELGHGNLESDEHPKEIACMDSLKVSEISCGSWHNAVLTEDGDVYVWGWNKLGQLGDSFDLGSVVEIPTPLELDTSVLSVSSFRNATFLFLKGEKIITFGDFRYNCA